MRVAGIIAEYNPFHNGHMYHLRRTRQMLGCDYVVAVMAGCFTQRGDPALLDKWARARTALTCGVDLVVELPALFAVRSAEGFARGGVGLLGALGLVDDLSFGCETDDIHLLSDMTRLVRDEPPQLRHLIREGLDRGLSHPRARGAALCALLQVAPEAVSAPNTALALEYMRANQALSRPMRPLPVRRGVGYHSRELGEIASASAIREAFARDADVSRALPAPIEGPLSRPEALDDLLLYRLRGMDARRLGALPDVPEGLERRILQMADRAAGRRELIDLIKCKRYTRARISRALTHALLGMDAALCRAVPTPPYARVLGFREDARPLLRAIQRVGSVPLVTDPARLAGNPCFLQERRATDLWGLTTASPALRRAGRDATERVVVV